MNLKNTHIILGICILLYLNGCADEIAPSVNSENEFPHETLEMSEESYRLQIAMVAKDTPDFIVQEGLTDYNIGDFLVGKSVEKRADLADYDIDPPSSFHNVEFFLESSISQNVSISMDTSVFAPIPGISASFEAAKTVQSASYIKCELILKDIQLSKLSSPGQVIDDYLTIAGFEQCNNLVYGVYKAKTKFELQLFDCNYNNIEIDSNFIYEIFSLGSGYHEVLQGSTNSIFTLESDDLVNIGYLIKPVEASE